MDKWPGRLESVLHYHVKDPAESWHFPARSWWKPLDYSAQWEH